MAEPSAGPVDWPGLMRLGLGVLRLPPEAFWAMTPGEFRRALEGAGIVPIGGGARSMDRGRLAELMAAFPDRRAGARETALAGEEGGVGPHPTSAERSGERSGRGGLDELG